MSERASQGMNERPPLPRTGRHSGCPAQKAGVQKFPLLLIVSKPTTADASVGYGLSRRLMTVNDAPIARLANAILRSMSVMRWRI